MLSGWNFLKGFLGTLLLFCIAFLFDVLSLCMLSLHLRIELTLVTLKCDFDCPL